jgi:hypothetical protein
LELSKPTLCEWLLFLFARPPTQDWSSISDWNSLVFENRFRVRREATPTVPVFWGASWLW